MEFLIEYGLFLAKTITLVVAIVVLIAMIVSANIKNHSGDKGHLEVTKINERFEDLADTVTHAVLDSEAFKLKEKQRKKKEKEEKKKHKAELKKQAKQAKQAKSDASGESSEEIRKRVFVADFDGDIKASATEELKEVITAILSVAKETDEVVVRLESPGGLVHSYGLASSQLKRITQKNIPLTVCVDKVAASGGYMMACVANKIVSAPFAVIGSIGVVAQIPNFHRLLKKNDVDFEMLTAGEYKRTLTMFGENTDKGRKKFIEDLEDTHTLFKDFIAENRKQVDVDSVATGEIWFGARALEKNLVDQIETSDQYLFDLREDADIFELKWVQKKSLPEKLGMSVDSALERVVSRWLQRANTKFFS